MIITLIACVYMLFKQISKMQLEIDNLNKNFKRQTKQNHVKFNLIMSDEQNNYTKEKTNNFKIEDLENDKNDNEEESLNECDKENEEESLNECDKENEEESLNECDQLKIEEKEIEKTMVT